MRFFPFTLKERAKEWFFTLGREFDSWRDMEDAFLCKYYSVGKTSDVRRAIREFSQGPGEVFYEAWERLRDLLRQCPHHGIPKHEITQIFYDDLGAPDRYLLDVACGGTFMSKYEDEALELIELVAENRHHHVAKSFGGRSAPSKGGMLDAKAAMTGMLLDKIEKLTEAQNLIMDSLKVRPGSDCLAPVSHVDISSCSHCSSFEHVELDCPVMAFQGQFPFQPNPTTYPGLSQAGRSTYPNQGYSSLHNPTYVQQRSGQHTSYHQPYGSAPQHMGNSRPTYFAPGIPRAVTPPPAVPPLAPSVDPVMSALAQMMSKLNEVSDRLDRVEGAKAQCSDTSTEQRKGKRVEFSDQLPSQPLANPRNVGQASSSRTHNVNKVCIDGASEEAHAISGLRSGKVLVDPHTDHKRRKAPLEERDDRPSPTIILEEDSEDEEAPDEESRAVPNPEVYKPPVPYPQLLSRPKVPTSDSDDTLLEAFRQVTITIPLVDAIRHISPYAKFLIGLCTAVRKPKRIHMSETISSIMRRQYLRGSGDLELYRGDDVGY